MAVILGQKTPGEVTVAITVFKKKAQAEDGQLRFAARFLSI